MLESQVTSIFKSCRKGSLFTAPDVPQLSTLAHLRDTDDRSLLDVAIAYKHLHLVTQLCSTAFLGNRSQCTRAFELAVETDDLEIIEKVADAIYSVYQANEARATSEYSAIINGAFKAACHEGKLEVVRWFLANPTLRLSNPFGRPNPPMRRIIFPDGYFIDEFEDYSLNLNAPLLRTWCRGHVGVVKELFAAGATGHQWVSADNSCLFLDVLVESNYEDARRYHGGDREALLDLLFTSGAVWDVDMYTWKSVFSYGTVPLLCRMLESLPNAHSLHAIDDAVGFAFRENKPDVVFALLKLADRRNLKLDDNKLFDFALRDGHRELAEVLFRRPAVDMAADLREDGDPDEDGDPYEFEDTDSWNAHVSMDRSMVLMYAVACSSLVIATAVMQEKWVRCDRIYDHYLCGATPFTPLSRASDPAIIRLLLDAKARIDPPSHCDTVLRGACKKLRVDSVKMLLAAGADVNRHVAGRSALSYAVLALCPEESIADKIDVINALFDAGCSVQRAEDGSSIMHSADSDTIWELASVADVLASRDPSIVHCSNCKGVTALMTVVGSPVKAVSLVTSLLYAGANPRARDNRGASALFYLFYTNFRSKSEDITDIHEILGILISAGADLTACKDTGETLLIQAVSKVEHRLRYGIISQATKYSDEETSALLSAILDAVAAQEQEQEVEEEVEVVEQQVEQEQERERGVEEVVKKKKSRGDDVPPQKRVKRQAA